MGFLIPAPGLCHALVFTGLRTSCFPVYEQSSAANTYTCFPGLREADVITAVPASDVWTDDFVGEAGGRFDGRSRGFLGRRWSDRVRPLVPRTWYGKSRLFLLLS